MAEEQWTQLKKLLLPRKQLFCRAKRHINAPTNYRTGVTWRTRRFDLEKCDLALTTHPGFQCCSSLLQLSIMWPSMNLLCSRCGFPVCWWVFWLLCLAAPRIQAQLHPSRHLGPCSRRHPALCPPHPRPATHPPSGLLQGLFGFMLLPLFSHWLGPLFMQCSASSSTLFLAIQTCTCFLTGKKKRFVKTPGKITDNDQSGPVYPKLFRDNGGPAPALLSLQNKSQSWEGPSAWTMAFSTAFWTLSSVSELIICDAKSLGKEQFLSRLLFGSLSESWSSLCFGIR